MAIDEREYILNRRGWNPAKLTGCRKNPEIYNPKEFRKDRTRKQHDYETLPETKLPSLPHPSDNAAWIKIFLFLFAALIAFTAWTIYRT